MSRLDDIRKQTSKRRKAPSAIRILDIMEHRFWLFVTGVKIKDLDKYVKRFRETFE